MRTLGHYLSFASQLNASTPRKKTSLLKLTSRPNVCILHAENKRVENAHINSLATGRTAGFLFDKIFYHCYYLSKEEERVQLPQKRGSN
jgi:hypothetical protein